MFEESFDLPAKVESILITCCSIQSGNDTETKKQTVYTNAHSVVRRKPEKEKIFNDFKASNPDDKPLSVLMMGIDSVSRLNMYRAMPETAEYLQREGWFELEGYTKVNKLNCFKKLIFRGNSFCTSVDG